MLFLIPISHLVPLLEFNLIPSVHLDCSAFEDTSAILPLRIFIPSRFVICFPAFMCGRYRRTTQEEELARLYHIPIPKQTDLPISYNIAYRTINARAETVDRTPSFRQAFSKRRCLIPADGFYEWRKTVKPKLPFAIAMKDGHPFTFAGLWENWKDPESGEWLRTCTIITGEPNELVALRNLPSGVV